MHLTEAELTVVVTAVAKATLTAQSKEIRKGRVDIEDVWRDLGGYGRYQLLDALGAQYLPVLASLPEVPRVHGARPSYTDAQVRAAVEQHAEDDLGRVRRMAVVVARAALLQQALAQLPVWFDPEAAAADDS